MQTGLNTSTPFCHPTALHPRRLLTQRKLNFNPLKSSNSSNGEIPPLLDRQYELIGASALNYLMLESPVSASESGPLLPGISISTGTFVLAPVVLYAIFTIYRTAFNRNAKISDFLLLIASVFIFGNILTALVFKVRLF